jgi:ribosome-binding factor A
VKSERARNEEIKRKRTESTLMELIPEALGTLSDEVLHSLNIVSVVCSRGRSDAKVYLERSFYTEEEERFILQQLKKARSRIEQYCKTEQGWFKTPKLSFYFRDNITSSDKIEELLLKASKEISKK